MVKRCATNALSPRESRRMFLNMSSRRTRTRQSWCKSKIREANPCGSNASPLSRKNKTQGCSCAACKQNTASHARRGVTFRLVALFTMRCSLPTDLVFRHRWCGGGFFFFRRVGNQRFGGQNHCCDGRRVLQRAARDFGWVNDARREQIFILLGHDVKAEIHVVFLFLQAADFADDYSAVLSC